MEGDTACQYSYYYASIIGKGAASIIDNPREKLKALNVIMKHQTGRTFDEFQKNPNLEKAVAIIRIDLNDASLTRTVDYGTGSYQARGNTTGAGFGAMYELAYDIALNEDRSVILQPLFNASIVTTRMDGYRESGSAGNAGLKVEDQELTTAAVAVGARLSGLMGSNVFGREALGEVRVNVSQDMGDVPRKKKTSSWRILNYSKIGRASCRERV